jgi:CheY-like chemotaxis protein
MQARIDPIAMVDDDVDDRMMVSRALASLDPPIRLLEFDGAEDFLDYLASEEGRSDMGRPALVLLDLNMPRLDGWEVLRRMKLSKDRADIPVIVFTGSESPVDIQSSYAQGAASFITKPKSYKDLVEALRLATAYWSVLVSLP